MNNPENEQGFERVRRITGYLAGDVSRFNNAKRSEEKERVKHTSQNITTKTEKEK